MKPSEVAKNMQEAIDLLTKQREEYLAAHPDASEPVHDELPTDGDVYWCLTDSPIHPVGYFEVTHTRHHADFSRIATGNCFRTKAEAIRRREALKVQAELRRMPGRCAPPDDGEPKYCIDYDDWRNFRVYRSVSIGHAMLAAAGVWFATEEAARYALDTIGQDRLRMWLDDYLQTPMEGGAQ